jgi:predicted AAA+ superfamily ATPase
MIPRDAHAATVLRLLDQFPVVALLGARQVGKTTLAGMVAAQWAETTRFDLEDPRDETRLAAPMLALEPLRGLVVLDEIQRRPDLFPMLRVLADRPGTPARFLILGSASPELIRASAESLAGRVAHHELPGLGLAEVGAAHWQQCWLRGGYPPSFLASDDLASLRWRQELIRTLLDRDLPALGLRLPAETLRRFWQMLAHYHGQIWNGAELARAFGVSEKTVRHYLDLLVSTYMVRVLPPWHANFAKRQVRSPKVYIADPGLLHALLGLGNLSDLTGHPKVGASWEGFAIAAIMAALGARREECSFWALHTGAELDLLVVRGQRRLGFEIKLTDSPRMTPSVRSALEHLELERLYLVHAGEHRFPLAERVDALPLRALATWAG